MKQTEHRLDGSTVEVGDDDALPVADEPVRFPWDDPRWQGHTHEYGDEPSSAGLFTCRECGMPATIEQRFPSGEGVPGD